MDRVLEREAPRDDPIKRCRADTLADVIRSENDAFAACRQIGAEAGVPKYNVFGLERD